MGLVYTSFSAAGLALFCVFSVFEDFFHLFICLGHAISEETGGYSSKFLQNVGLFFNITTQNICGLILLAEEFFSSVITSCSLHFLVGKSFSM